jgi:hypothetical protein
MSPLSVNRYGLRGNRRSHRNPNLVRPGQRSDKRWTFFKSCKLQDFPFIAEQEALEAQGDILDIFLRDNLAAYVKVKEFCRLWQSKPTGSTMTASESARAWVNLRSKPTGHIQGLSHHLTSSQLLTVLSEVMDSISLGYHTTANTLEVHSNQ